VPLNGWEARLEAFARRWAAHRAPQMTPGWDGSEHGVGQKELPAPVLPLALHPQGMLAGAGAPRRAAPVPRLGEQDERPVQGVRRTLAGFLSRMPGLLPLVRNHLVACYKAELPVPAGEAHPRLVALQTLARGQAARAWWAGLQATL
jgi:hypothetical protein